MPPNLSRTGIHPYLQHNVRFRLSSNTLIHVTYAQSTGHNPRRRIPVAAAPSAPPAPSRGCPCPGTPGKTSKMGQGRD